MILENLKKKIKFTLPSKYLSIIDKTKHIPNFQRYIIFINAIDFIHKI